MMAKFNFQFLLTSEIIHADFVLKKHFLLLMMLFNIFVENIFVIHIFRIL